MVFFPQAHLLLENVQQYISRATTWPRVTRSCLDCSGTPSPQSLRISSYWSFQKTLARGAQGEPILPSWEPTCGRRGHFALGGGSAQMCGADQHRPQPPPRPLRCETPPIGPSVCLLSLLHTHLHCSIQYTLVAKLAGLAGIMYNVALWDVGCGTTHYLGR